MKLIKVTSDNYTDQLFTPAAYKELTLTMSTGDFHTHKRESIEVTEPDWDNTIALIRVKDWAGNIMKWGGPFLSNEDAFEAIYKNDPKNVDEYYIDFADNEGDKQ